MFGEIETIENSEFNNVGALLGLDGEMNNELLGALKQLPPIRRQMAINKLTQPVKALVRKWKNIFGSYQNTSKMNWQKETCV
jgi:hypothetical protein